MIPITHRGSLALRLARRSWSGEASPARVDALGVLLGLQVVERLAKKACGPAGAPNREIVSPNLGATTLRMIARE